MTYSDKSRHNQDSSTQVVQFGLRDRVAGEIAFLMQTTDPTYSEIADAATAAVWAFLSDPDTQLPRQAIYAGKMATFDALGADDIERVIRAVAGSLLQKGGE